MQRLPFVVAALLAATTASAHGPSKGTNGGQLVDAGDYHVEMVAKEMTEANADWQLHAYGHAMHAFTGQDVNAPESGMQYNADADRRSWIATVAFLEEVFA